MKTHYPLLFVLLALLLGGFGAAVAAPGDVSERAASAKTVAEALGALGVQNPEAGKKVLLEVPDIVDGSGKLPAKAQVNVLSKIPGTDWIAVLVDRNINPFVMLKEFSPGADRSLALTVDIAQTSKIRVLVRAGGKYYQVAREIKVASDGCTKP